MAGGGEGNEAAEALLRRFDVIELERTRPSSGLPVLFVGD